MNQFDAAMMPSEIILGFLDENHWRPQPFDCSSFLEKHPNGIMTLWVQPQGAAQAFPVALERDGNIFPWTPLDEEITAKRGKLQLMCVDGTDVGKSDVSYWRVGESIVPGAEHPADVPSWAAETIRRAEDAARRAEEAAKDIEIDPEQLAQAVADYLDTHPVEGEPGASAYELAVQEGYEGTLEAWLESLKGEPGPQGPHGDDYVLTNADKQEIAGMAKDLLQIDSTPTPGSDDPVSSGGAAAALQGKEDTTETVTMTATDTAVTLQKNKFYIFPEMAALTITCPATGGPFAFRFTSGATATTLSLTGITMPDDFTVEADTVYEINVYEGYGLAVSWEVTA